MDGNPTSDEHEEKSSSGSRCGAGTYAESLSGVMMNRLFVTICEHDDGNVSAWPAADFQGWKPDEKDKVRLFVPMYDLAG